MIRVKLKLILFPIQMSLSPSPKQLSTSSTKVQLAREYRPKAQENILFTVQMILNESLKGTGLHITAISHFKTSF